MLTKTKIGFCCASLAVGAGVVTDHVRDSSPQLRQAAPIVISSFSEAYSSATPADWATSADHVAEVTVTRESRGMSEGDAVERIVSIVVDQTLWSRDGAPALGNKFDMPAFGWVQTKDGLAELTPAGASRIEPGHRYLMGLIHLDPRCNADDGLVVRGGWSVIGSSGSIPLDGGDLGQGEVEGANNQAVSGQPGTMLDAAETAATPEDVVSLVEQAPAGDRPAQPGVREGC